MTERFDRFITLEVTIPFFFSLAVCTRQVFNLAFLIDGSESIKSLPPDDISRYKALTKSIFNFYNVSLHGANVGAVVYSTNSTTEFKFDQFYSKSEIDRVIDGIVFPGESTRTGNGLTVVRDSLFAGGRGGIPNFLVVLTDGVATDHITLPSAFLRAMNVYILAVGIGDFYSRTQLNDIASDPHASYVFEASGFDVLQTTASRIKERICRGKVRCNVLMAKRMTVYNLFDDCIMGETKKQEAVDCNDETIENLPSILFRLL